ncbi:hypothetical protein E2I00_016713 [Balaenoptera physalus]|uniref:CAP-Gly domain-containing protein n=1 Tax=Balaenoptera physalus TaxID=9770 RepID=A0A643BSB9_BALPH|nr:hypothetical protein E2I00_016713 [Balaenoptera physalus]
MECKLQLVVGSPASCMELELYGPDDKFYSKLDQEDALLGSYPVDDGCRIHEEMHQALEVGVSLGGSQRSREDRHTAQRVHEQGPSSALRFQCPGAINDVDANSVRSFLKRNKLGRYSEEERAQQEAESSQRLTEEAQAGAIPVGSRCEVQAPGQPPRRGTVMYVGLTDFKPGYWIGVRYDEPLGKNDGSVNGKRYFECQAKYGAFVKPSVVTVGDFPEEDYGLDEM